jgi:hypothetical protein
VVPLGLSTAWALDVNDSHDRRWHIRYAQVTARLDHDFVSAADKRFHQWIHVSLQQRLSTGDLDKVAAI